MKYWYKIF